MGKLFCPCRVICWMLVLDNYLSVDKVGRQLMDESVELGGEDLPQSRDDPG